MNSSNNDTNRIVSIEAIESGISSNFEKKNQIVPFSQTEKPFQKVAFVRQISNSTDDKTIHYISWLFGILLTCTALIFLIVPLHNVLKEPYYMYEHYAFTVFHMPIWAAVYIMRCEYWANIKYVKNWTSFFILSGSGVIIYCVLSLSYFHIWVYYHELYAPLPYGGIIPPNLTLNAFIFILFFRYHHT